MNTADLIDDHADALSLVHLPFRRFGRAGFCAGPVQTVSCFEDNALLRAELETAGHGRVLVVDGGGATRVALVGDMLAGLAIANGWAGLILNAAIRDSAEIDTMDTAVFALGTSPVKSSKHARGAVGGPVRFGGVTFHPGDWAYADADGVLHCTRQLI